MRRLKFGEYQLPDAINKHDEKGDFTQVPHSIIRNSNMSTKAKMILIMLLSNKPGWITRTETLASMMKEGRKYIVSGLEELEQLGYARRLRFRDKKTKVWKGSFWAYTDIAYDFNYHKNARILEKEGCEIVCKTMETHPQPEKGVMASTPENMGQTAETPILPTITLKATGGFRTPNNTNYYKTKMHTPNGTCINKNNVEFIPNKTCGTNHATDKGWRYLRDTGKPAPKGMKAHIIDDGIQYDLCTDGEYRHCVSGDLYIP